MTHDIQIQLIFSNSPKWDEQVDQIRTSLGAPDNQYLFPPHFVKSVLPKIGGKLILVHKQEQNLAVGFLFPENLHNQKPEFTLRIHKIDKQFELDLEVLKYLVEKKIKNCNISFYFPESDHRFEKTSKKVKGFEIGRPGKKEAEKIRLLQQKIWGYNSESDQDFLYPSDIHSVDFQIGTSLVVRNAGVVIGFVIGFFKYDRTLNPGVFGGQFNNGFRIESQLLGVLPGFRGRGLGKLLKKVQAENALKQNIDIINWTVDPLQFRNAVLNFSELQAVSFNFYKNYYSFKNELNMVASSRLGIFWLVRSERVTRALSRDLKKIVNLNKNPGIQIVNIGYENIILNSTAKSIAIEIPARWTTLQKENLALAQKWRETTDKIFVKYIGIKNGDYMITGVGEKSDCKYLIADRVDQQMLQTVVNREH